MPPLHAYSGRIILSSVRILKRESVGRYSKNKTMEIYRNNIRTAEVKSLYGGAKFCKEHQRIYINECCDCGLAKIPRINKGNVVLQNIRAYYKKNPSASWKEIFENTEHHYGTPISLLSAMSLRGFAPHGRSTISPEQLDNIGDALKEAEACRKIKSRTKENVERKVEIAKTLHHKHNLRPGKIAKLMGKDRTTIIYYLKHYKTIKNYKKQKNTL